MKTCDARTVEQWRAWLAKHHASESEVWLIFNRRHTGQPSIDYKDALDEALCFGWVDSLIKRLDEGRYARKFTPRKPDSSWSAINRKRYAELKAGGRLQPAGIRRAPTSRVSKAPPISVADTVPPYIERALRKNAKAWRFFEQLAPSQRRHYLVWIEMAKREETKARRLQEAMRLLAAGQKLGLK